MISKDTLLAQWQTAANTAGKLLITTEAYADLPLSPYFTKTGITNLTVDKPKFEDSEKDMLVVKGSFREGPIECTEINIIVFFFPNRNEIAIISRLNNIGLPWLIEKTSFSLPDKLPELKSAGAKDVILMYSSDDNTFKYTINFEDKALSVLDDYNIRLKKPSIQLTQRGEKIVLVTLYASAAIFDSEYEVELQVPLISSTNWEFALLEATGPNLKLDELLTQTGGLTKRENIVSALPAPVAGPFSGMGIGVSSLSLIYPNDLSGTANFDIEFYSLDAFQLIPSVKLNIPALAVSGAIGAGGAYTRVVLSGRFFIGASVIVEALVAVSSKSDEPWTLHLEADAELENLELFDELPFPIPFAELGLPGDMIKMERIKLENFTVEFIPGQQKITNIELAVNAKCSLQLIRGIKLQDPFLMVSYKPGEASSLNGYFKADLMIGETSFWGKASKNGDNWILEAGTGLTEPFRLKQFAADLSTIAGFTIPDELVPDLTAYQTFLSFETATSSFSFRTTLQTAFNLPFITNQQAIVGSYIDLNLTKTGDTYDFTVDLIASLKIGPALFAVQFTKDTDNRTFKAGWAADEGSSLSLAVIADAIGIDIDTDNLPDIINPELTEVAFSYSEKDNTLALSAYTESGTTAYLIAKKNAAGDWKYAIGIDYKAAGTNPDTEQLTDLLAAANTANIAQFTVMYAGMDLEGFELPRTPRLPSGMDAVLPVAAKTITVKAGLFLVAAVQNISLPSFGKLQPDLKRFYVEVAWATGAGMRALVKGDVTIDVDGMAAPLLVTVSAAYDGKTGSAEFKGKLAAETGLLPFATAVLPEGFTLPDDFELPDLTSVAVTFNTQTNDFSFTLDAHPERNKLKIPDLLTVGAKSIKLEKTGSNFEFVLQEGLLDFDILSDVFEKGVGGTLNLKISPADKEVSFTPSQFTIRTPAISYDEVLQVQENGRFDTTKKEIYAEAAMGALSIIKNANGWEISAGASLKLNGMPYPASLLFDVDSGDGSRAAKLFAGTLSISKSGVSVAVSANPLVHIDIPDITAMLGNINGIPKFGWGALRINAITCNFGKNIDISIDGGIGLPAQLNQALKLPGQLFRTYKPGMADSFVGFNLKFGTSGISGKLTGSMFENLAFLTEEENDYVGIDFNSLFGVDNVGKISIKKPEISFSTKSGSFKFKGGYKIDPKHGLNVPMLPLKSLLNTLKLQLVSDLIPASVPVKTMVLEDLIQDLVYKLEDPKLGCPKQLIDVLNDLDKSLDKFPARFKSYLSINVPESMDVDINITADGGISFNVETTGDPLQMLMPTALGLVGYRIQRMSFGTAFGGSLLKAEISAEVDVFDYLTLAASYLFLDTATATNWLPARADIRRTFTATDLVLLIIYETGIPIPIPLFYKALDINSMGIEGVGLVTSISFPKPEFNIIKLLRIIHQAKNFISLGTDFDVRYPISFENQEDHGLNLVFSTGPFYLQLPKYMAQEQNGLPMQIGIKERYRLVDVLNTTGIILNGMKHLIMEGSPAYLVKAFPLQYRYGSFSARLMRSIDLDFKYVIASPAELLEISTQMPDFFRGQDSALLMLSKIQAGSGVVLNKDQKPGIKAVQPVDNNLAAFMAGNFSIGSAIHFNVQAGLIHAGNNFGAFYNVSAVIDNNIFNMQLNGMALIREEGFAIEGNAGLALYDIDLFKGRYIIRDNYLLIEATGPTGIPDLPFEFYGKMEGVLDKNMLALNGQVKLMFLGLSSAAVANLLVTDIPGNHNQFNFLGVVQYSNVSLLKVELTSTFSSTEQQIFAKINANLLEILKLDFEGFGYISGKRYVLKNATATLTLLGKPVLNASVTTTHNSVTINGSFDFFAIVGVTYVAVIENDAFSLDANGTLDIGPFKSATHINVIANNSRQELTLTVTNLLVDEVMEFKLINNSGNQMELSYMAPQPLHLLFGALTVDALTTGGITGPILNMKLSHSRFEELYFNGRVSFLGFMAAGVDFRLNPNELKFDFSWEWAIGGLLASRMNLNCLYKPDSFYMSTSAQFSLDLIWVFKQLFFPNASTIQSLPVIISIDYLTISIERHYTPAEKEDRELREYQEYLARLLEEAARRARAMDADIDQHITSFDDTIFKLRTSGMHEATVNDYCNRLDNCKTVLNNMKVSFANRVATIAETEAAVELLKNRYKSTLADINTYMKDWKDLCDAAEDWYRNHYYSNSHNGYEDALGKLRGNIAKLYALQGQEKADNTLSDMVDHLYGYWFSHAWDNGWHLERSNDAHELLKLMYNEAHDSVGVDQVNMEDTLKPLKADLELVKNTIEANKKAGDGVVILALADLRAFTLGRLNSEEIVNRRIGPVSLRRGPEGFDGDKTELTIQASISFKIGDHHFNLTNLRWVSTISGDYNGPDIMAQMPAMITDYLLSNFTNIFIKTVGSIPAAIMLVRDLIVNTGNKRTRGVDSSDLDALALVTGLHYADIDLMQEASGLNN